MKKLILQFLIFFLWVTPCLATDYFVKNGGNDGLDGLSDANAGETLVLVTHDLRGLTRPQGAAYDIGAYEFGPAINISGLTLDGVTLN